MSSKKKPLADLPLYPLVVYSWAETHDVNWHCQEPRHKETRLRLWGLYTFLDKGRRCCLEARVIMSPIWDFCGGLSVHSPQVRRYWEPRGDAFMDNGAFLHSMERDGVPNLSLSYTDLTEDRAIDLDELFPEQSPWTFDEASEYAWRSLAAGVISTATCRSKRGVVGSDRVHGKNDKLFQYMDDLAANFTPVPCSPVHARHIMDEKLVSASRTPCGAYRLEWMRISGEQLEKVNWWNANSGHQVTWLGFNFTSSVDEEMMEYHNIPYWDQALLEKVPHSRVMPEAFTRCINSVDYVRQVPRLFWRNG